MNNDRNEFLFELANDIFNVNDTVANNESKLSKEELVLLNEFIEMVEDENELEEE